MSFPKSIFITTGDFLGDESADERGEDESIIFVGEGVNAKFGEDPNEGRGGAGLELPDDVSLKWSTEIDPVLEMRGGVSGLEFGVFMAENGTFSIKMEKK